MPPGMLAPPPPPQRTSGGSICALHVATFFAIRTYDQASGLAWGPQATRFPWSPPKGSPWRTGAPAFRRCPAAPGGEVEPVGAIYPPYLYVGHGDRRDHLCLSTVVTVHGGVTAGGVRRGWRC